MDSRQYIADTSMVEALMKDRLKADSVLAGTRNTYLRMLIATAQHRLGIQRVSNKQADDDTIAAHADMLGAVHGEFYEVVKRVAESVPIDPDTGRDRDSVLAARIVFARSSYSTVRNWIVRGRHSLASIMAAKALKRKLAEDTPKRHVSGTQKLRIAPLMHSAEVILEKIVEQGKTDREAAILALQDILNMLTHGFDKLGMPAVSIREAVEHTATGVVEVVTPIRRRGRKPLKKAA